MERHGRTVKIVAGITAVILVVGTGYAILLNSKFGNIARVDTPSLPDRPDPDEGRALNVLLLGADRGQRVAGSTPGMRLSEAVAAERWPSGRYRSDTIMLVHIAANRKHVYLVSIPRDTYAQLYDATGKRREWAKINAAFSDYGPSSTISTLEHLSLVRMEHLAIINFNGFKDITRAVGGVQVYIPKSFYDPSQKVYWKAGKQKLTGKRALKYVRTRYGLPRSDFDRIARQQNFMRALMGQLLAKGTTRNPIRLARTLSALTENMVVDADWSQSDMRSLALSLRNIESDDVTFITAPVAGTETIPGVGDVVRLDEERSTALFRALAVDRMGPYVKANRADVLKSDREVS